MRSLNKVTFIGHLAADVDFRQTKNGRELAKFPIALNRYVKGEDGERKQVTDFHRIVVWGPLGRICHEYLASGSAVYLEGRLINDIYDDKDGNRQYKTEIIAHEVNILTWRKNQAGKEETYLEDVREVEKSKK